MESSPLYQKTEKILSSPIPCDIKALQHQLEIILSDQTDNTNLRTKLIEAGLEQIKLNVELENKNKTIFELVQKIDILEKSLKDSQKNAGNNTNVIGKIEHNLDLIFKNQNSDLVSKIKENHNLKKENENIMAQNKELSIQNQNFVIKLKEMEFFSKELSNDLYRSKKSIENDSLFEINKLRIENENILKERENILYEKRQILEKNEELSQKIEENEINMKLASEIIKEIREINENLMVKNNEIQLEKDSKLKEKINNYEKELKNLQNKIENSNEIYLENEQLKLLFRENEEKTIDALNQIEEMQNIIKDLFIKNEKFKQENISLEGDLKFWKEKTQDAVETCSKMTSVTEEANHYKDQINNLEKKLFFIENENKKLINNINIYDQEILNLKAQNASFILELDNTNNKYNKDLNDLNNKINILIEMNNDLNKIIENNKLNKKKSIDLSNYNEFYLQNEILQNENKCLIKKLINKNEQFNKINSEYENLKIENKNISDSLEIKSKLIRELEANVLINKKEHNFDCNKSTDSKYLKNKKIKILCQENELKGKQIEELLKAVKSRKENYEEKMKKLNEKSVLKEKNTKA